METRRRREAILDIVAAEAVGTQEELVESLRRRGFDVSQASVSRDTSALGLVKVDGRYARLSGSKPSEDPFAQRVRANLLALREAGPNLLVVITPAGEASPVAIAIDRAGIPGVQGTIAGDDTIFVALRDAKAGAEFRRRLKRAGVRV
jgi:transcriptional regulator of arginine metabolism